MDVYLKQRFDLIPNLVDTVKAYAKHEADTLEELTKRRAGVATSDIDGQIEGEMRIGEALSRILVIAEKYPELKASENFLDLHKRIAIVEMEFFGEVRKVHLGIDIIEADVEAAYEGT